MTGETTQLDQEIQTGFRECTREELEGYAKQAFISYHPSISDDKLRDRLCTTLTGEMTEVLEDASPPPAPKITGVGPLLNLNLTPSGVWQGRRRRVMLQRQFEKQKAPLPFAWQRQHYYVPFDVPVDVPYPIYNILNTGVKTQRLIQKQKRDDDGREYIENSITDTTRVHYSDMGDSPIEGYSEIKGLVFPKDTDMLNLPRSQKEQYQWAAEQTNNFAEYSNLQMRKLLSKYTNKITEHFREWPDQEVREHLLELLDIEVEADLAA